MILWFNWIAGGLGSLMGLIGLIFMLRATFMLKDVFKTGMLCLSIAIAGFTIFGIIVGIAATIYDIPEYAGTYLVPIYIVSMIFILIGSIKLYYLFIKLLNKKV